MAKWVVPVGLTRGTILLAQPKHDTIRRLNESSLGHDPDLAVRLGTHSTVPGMSRPRHGMTLLARPTLEEVAAPVAMRGGTLVLYLDGLHMTIQPARLIVPELAQHGP